MLAILKTFSDNLVDRPAEIENFHFKHVTECFGFFFERMKISEQSC